MLQHTICRLNGVLKHTLRHTVRDGTTAPVTPDVLAAEPILSVPDVPAAIAWWTTNLGAAGGWEWRQGPDHPVGHGGARLGRAAVQFSLDPGPVGGTAVFFTTGFTSADALDAYAATVSRKLGGLRREPADCPWGLREFQVDDPQGRLLRFAGPTSRPASPGGPAIEFVVLGRKPTPGEWAEITKGVGWHDNPFGRAAELLDGTRHGVVAVVGDRAVGCVLVVSEGVNSAYFSDVAVLPEFQGRGVGDAMMRAALAWCGENLEPTATLALSTGRGTAPFYERLGFRGGDEDGGYGMSRRNGPASG